MPTTTDTYIDGLILRNGVPAMWQFDGGDISLDANGNPTSWNYKTTPYSYCNGDPVNRFDLDGREVKPDSNSLDVIKNTLDFKDVNFTSCIGNTQGETGNLGVTYMPKNGGPGKGPIDGSSIDININPTLSPIGAAETFAHEGYGHANIYVLTNGNRNAAIHHYVVVKENNSTLFNFSIRARKETVKNMTR